MHASPGSAALWTAQLSRYCCAELKCVCLHGRAIHLVQSNVGLAVGPLTGRRVGGQIPSVLKPYCSCPVHTMLQDVEYPPLAIVSSTSAPRLFQPGLKHVCCIICAQHTSMDFNFDSAPTCTLSEACAQKVNELLFMCCMWRHQQHVCRC